MKEINIYFKPSMLFISIGSILYSNSYAEDAAQLEAIDVIAVEEIEDSAKQTVEREQLDTNMVQDVRDMVRYDPGISVVEGGRAGSNGFAIRGVDKDRVAITVDGLAQAESRSSEGFQELFGAYGNFNTNRNAAELENISTVEVLKGADSITAGSGALGGAVMYHTKSPSDYLTEGKDYYAGLKAGYTSKNRQKFGSITLAAQRGAMDGLVVYTSRSGHELKNFDKSDETSTLNYTDENIKTYEGIMRENPDPQNVSSKSGLIKLGYHLNQDNYLSFVYEDYRQDRHTDELSNVFSVWTDEDVRRRNDVSYRRRVGLEYENIRDSGPWDRMRFNIDKQRIEMTTVSWDTPEVNTKKGVNLSVPMSRRGLYQDLIQAKLEAEKYLDWDDATWDIFYGAGVGKNTNTNDNKEFFTYAYRPGVLATDENNSENLIEAESRQYHLYWNNAFNWQDKYKLTAGLRYDKYRMNTLPDEKYNKRLASKGLLNAKANFGALSYSLGFDWHATPSFTVLSKYSTGFRAPTTDEMWFNFNYPDFSVRYNPDLKEEHAKNMELGFDWHGDWGNLRLSGFYTRYKDFIDFAYIGGKPMSYWDYSSETWEERDVTAPTYQNINRESATVKGVELRGHWALKSIGMPDGMYSNIAASYNKGKTDGNTPINAIQPFNAVLGLGYEQPDGKWGMASNVSYFARKKPEDTIYSSEHPELPWPYAKHSRSVWLLDLTGHYQLTRNFSVRAGIFNVFNQHYYTWNSLRGIREFGAVNRVSSEPGNPGIERFSAPGRNFSVMFEGKF